MKTLRPALGLAAAALVAASLTGCAGQILQQLSQDGIEKIVEDQTGGDVNIDTSGEGNLSLPDGFPAEVPVPAGNIYYSQAADGVYLISLWTKDVATAEAGYQDLLNSGFTQTAEIAVEEGIGYYATESDTLVVGYSWQASDDGRAAVALNVAVKK
jgi:hypothetical protein